MTKTPVFSLLVAALLLAGCDVKVDDKGLSLNVGGREASDEWTRTYDLPAGGRLDIANTNGNIDVTGSDLPGVEVRATRRMRANSEEEARQLLKGLDMGDVVSAAGVTIEARPVAASAGVRRNEVGIQYRVRVPAGLVLALRTTNGTVKLHNTSGAITAATTNGAVEAELTSVSGDVMLATTNGGVRLDLPTDVQANLDAACVNGGISIDDQFKANTLGDNSRCRVSAALNGGGPRVSAATVNGGIRIRARGSRQTD